MALLRPGSSGAAEAVATVITTTAVLTTAITMGLIPQRTGSGARVRIISTTAGTTRTSTTGRTRKAVRRSTAAGRSAAAAAVAVSAAVVRSEVAVVVVRSGEEDSE